MGSIYKRKWKAPDGTAHESTVWWIKYYRNGKPIRESSESTKMTVARDLLRDREGDIVKGVPVSPKTSRIRFDELAADMVTLAGEVRLEAGTTKNDDGRVFPFTVELRPLLAKLHSETRHIERQKGIIIPWVFHREGRRIQSFRKSWARACMASGLPVTVHYKRDASGTVLRYKEGSKKGEPVIERIAAKSIPHDFRRTAVRNLVRDGIHERVAMQMTGHKTRSVFDRYHIVSPGDLRDATRKLDAATAARSGLGTVTGTVAPNPATPSVENSANLLHFNGGPVAQKDRAAVS